MFDFHLMSVNFFHEKYISIWPTPPLISSTTPVTTLRAVIDITELRNDRN